MSNDEWWHNHYIQRCDRLVELIAEHQRFKDKLHDQHVKRYKYHDYIKR